MTMGIVDFAENVLGLRLYPAQRVILKAFYGESLDDSEVFWVRVSWDSEVLRPMTEAGYLEYLHREGRSSIGKIEFGGGAFGQLFLAAGRRSGKTVLGGVILAYEAERLLHLAGGDPHKYYGMGHGGSQIGLKLVSTDNTQAGYWLKEISWKIRQFAADRILNSTRSTVYLMTDGDVAEGFSPRASVRIDATSCRSHSMRGRGNKAVVLDEMAHYSDNGAGCGEEVYNSVVPSMACFSPKGEDGREVIGPNEGRLVAISSPRWREGAFWKFFERGMTRDAGILSMQIPTWEMNPSIPVEFYRDLAVRDPEVFAMEYGAEFVERSVGGGRKANLGCVCCPHCGKALTVNVGKGV